MAETLSQLLHLSWLPAASFFAGVLNSIAGGGSFLSLPALFASTAAVGVGAVHGAGHQHRSLLARPVDRAHRLPQGTARIRLGVAAPRQSLPGIGGWLGGFLLLRTGNRMFRELLPWLLLFAAVMFVLSFPLGRWLQTLSGGERHNKLLIVGMVIVSVYVGYFGAGGGFLVMALFGICGVHDIHEMNALKVLTAAVSIGIPAVSFISPGRVEWRFCLEMAFLAALGGYIGAHYSRRSTRPSCAGLSPLSAS